MTVLEKLIAHFERFPGVGARQAKRFAFHLLTEDEASRKEFAELIQNIHSNVTECTSCFRFFARSGTTDLCPICRNAERDRTKLFIVERDSDIDAVERSRMYDGLYFVLGGTVPLLESSDNKKIRGGILKHVVHERIAQGLTEIILGFAVNPDGENTARYVESLLREHIDGGAITTTVLGRGLSTGSELEYADPETIKSALRNRSKTV